ncbi:tripartite tricarboxylate transporter TctB family protein [Thermus sp.]|uniref:tripartite tricarboxylate transporter TctB family protein n=1 Tax=Thermus sp. TaxID=275 RepID=UPI00307E025B
MAERVWETLGALLALLLGGAALVLARGLPQMEGGYPGPALFPSLLGVVLVASSLGLFSAGRLGPRGEGEAGRLPRVLGALVGLGTAPLLLKALGLAALAGLLTLWAGFLLRGKGWAVFLAAGVVASFVYAFFVRILGVYG